MAEAAREAAEVDRLQNEIAAAGAALRRSLQKLIDDLPQGVWHKHKAFEGTELGAAPCLPIEIGSGERLYIFRRNFQEFYRSQRVGTHVKWAAIEPAEFIRRLGRDGARLLQDAVRARLVDAAKAEPTAAAKAEPKVASKAEPKSAGIQTKSSARNVLMSDASTLSGQKCPRCSKVRKGLEDHIRHVHPDLYRTLTSTTKAAAPIRRKRMAPGDAGGTSTRRSTPKHCNSPSIAPQKRRSGRDMAPSPGATWVRMPDKAVEDRLDPTRMLTQQGQRDSDGRYVSSVTRDDHGEESFP
ncbi:hypothetical protein [Sorangium sp. So ce406]|uniref:hypothetical protein n=1 Tax=Sorangium sp. So ce406 TaxID=3133311 RepID=UPI003F5CB940